MINLTTLVNSLLLLKIDYSILTDGKEQVVSFDTNSTKKRNVNVQFVFDLNGKLLRIEGDE